MPDKSTKQTKFPAPKSTSAVTAFTRHVDCFCLQVADHAAEILLTQILPFKRNSFFSTPQAKLQNFDDWVSFQRFCYVRGAGSWS